MKRLILGALLLLSTVSFGQIIITGNVNKYDPVNRMPPIKNSIIHARLNISENETVYSSSQFSISNDENGDYILTIPLKYTELNIQSISLECVNEYGKKIEIINSYKDTNVINFTFYTSTNTNYDIMKGYSDPISKNLAGDELLLYTKHFYTGTALTLAGGAIGLLSTSVISYYGELSGIEYNPTPGLVIGGLISVVGAVFIIEAPIHIKRAGLILNENGVGIKVKL